MKLLAVVAAMTALLVSAAVGASPVGAGVLTWLPKGIPNPEASISLGVSAGPINVDAQPAGAARSDGYVSLGDSFVSGPLLLGQQIDPVGCLRSDHNYPHLLAPRIAQALGDPSCSLAKTDHMTQYQVTPVGINPPQFDSLLPTTELVTLGIGGNDIEYYSWECPGVVPFGQPCQDRYVKNGHDTLSENVDKTGPKVAAVLQGIHARAPGARVLVVGYPTILPDSGDGCWPFLPITPSDVRYLRGVQKRLNSVLAAAAASNGATFVDIYTQSIGHDACAPAGVRWVEPVTTMSITFPVHPNDLGMQNMARIVEQHV